MLVQSAFDHSAKSVGGKFRRPKAGGTLHYVGHGFAKRIINAVALNKGSVKFSMKTLRYVGHGFAKRNINAVALNKG